LESLVELAERISVGKPQAELAVFEDGVAGPGSLSVCDWE
jgi:hypothetical protein